MVEPVALHHLLQRKLNKPTDPNFHPLEKVLIELSLPDAETSPIRITNDMQTFGWKHFPVADKLKLQARQMCHSVTSVCTGGTVGCFRVSVPSDSHWVLSVLVTFNWLTGLPAAESSTISVTVHYLITIIDYIPYNGLLLPAWGRDFKQKWYMVHIYTLFQEIFQAVTRLLPLHSNTFVTSQYLNVYPKYIVISMLKKMDKSKRYISNIF